MDRYLRVLLYSFWTSNDWRRVRLISYPFAGLRRRAVRRISARPGGSRLLHCAIYTDAQRATLRISSVQVLPCRLSGAAVSGSGAPRSHRHDRNGVLR
jgi:hypothetical protein